MMMEEKDFLGRPEKPDASDCCNSGCDPCVLDLYEKRLKDWENGFCNTSNRTSTYSEIRNDLLSETKLKPFNLINKVNLSKNVYRLTFQPVLNEVDVKVNDLLPINQMEKIIPGILPYKVGQHIIFKGYNISSLKNNFPDCVDKDIEHNEPERTHCFVSRAYTPITLSSEMSNCCFEIVVKIYDKGEMSQYLNTLQPGDSVACRGPYGNFIYSANKYRHILMLCIGTGIAPMYNIIKSIVNNDEDETFLQLMYGVQTVDDIILRDELRQFTAYWNFKEEIYLSRQCGNLMPKFGETFIYKRINNAAVLNYVSDKNKNELLVLICGSNLFSHNMEKCVLDLGIDKNNVHVF